MLKIDIHTHILPPEIPKFKDMFGYGGFIELHQHKNCCGADMQTQSRTKLPGRCMADKVVVVEKVARGAKGAEVGMVVASVAAGLAAGASVVEVMEMGASARAKAVVAAAVAAQVEVASVAVASVAVAMETAAVAKAMAATEVTMAEAPRVGRSLWWSCRCSA